MYCHILVFNHPLFFSAVIAVLACAVVVVDFVVNLDVCLLAFNYFIFISLLKKPLRVFAPHSYTLHVIPLYLQVQRVFMGVKTMKNNEKISID